MTELLLLLWQFAQWNWKAHQYITWVHEQHPCGGCNRGWKTEVIWSINDKIQHISTKLTVWFVPMLRRNLVTEQAVIRSTSLWGWKFSKWIRPHYWCFDLRAMQKKRLSLSLSLFVVVHAGWMKGWTTDLKVRPWYSQPLNMFSLPASYSCSGGEKE